MPLARSLRDCFLSSPIPLTCTTSSTPSRCRSTASARPSFAPAPRPSLTSTQHIVNVAAPRFFGTSSSAGRSLPGSSILLGRKNDMWKRFGPAVWANVLLAGMLLTAEAQPRSGPGSVLYPDTSTTVFHGTPAAAFGLAEVPGYGESSAPGYTTSAGGIT